jgi:AcrR family transcriptional regulator
VAVSLLSYYDDRHASSRLHTSVVLRRMSFTPAHTASWPEGLIATGSGAGFDPSDSILTWSWDIFGLWQGGTTEGENALKAAVVGMLQQLSLLRRFSVDEKTLQQFVNAVRAKYHENPFHNWRHAVAVMQASFLILCHTSATSMLTYQDIFACLIAALCHDIDHLGCSNGFLVATSHDLALRHNDDAPLERHHSATAAALLQDPRLDIFHSLDAEEKRRVRKVMVSTILATDMSRHFAHVQALSDRAARAVAERQAAMLAAKPLSPAAAEASPAAAPSGPEPTEADSVTATDGGGLGVASSTDASDRPSLMRAASDASASGSASHVAHKRLTALGRRGSSLMPNAEAEARGLLRSRLGAAELSPAFDRDDEKDRLFLLESIVHTADLSGQAFPHPVAMKWGDGIIEEFQKEAREYGKKGLTPPPFIANLDTPPQRAGCQSGFVSALVLPLWERMQDVLDGLGEPVRNLHSNLLFYETEAGKDTPVSSPAASVADDQDSPQD